MSRRSSADFLSLTHPLGPLKWRLHVDETLTGGRGSLFGGVGLAAGISALEQATGMPVIWATGQYLALTQQPVDIDLEVILPAQGRHVTQARVIGHIGDQEIITVIGAVGRRPPVAAGCWVDRPAAPPPEACPVIDRSMEGESIHRHVELRLARGCFGFTMFGEPTTDGRSLLWARMPGVEHDAAALGIIADYMPSVLGNALGRLSHCTSLDNTIRFASRKPTEWVLCDNRMEHVGAGFGHGTVHIWSEDGDLLATGSQSVIVRLPEPGAAGG